MQTNKMSKNWKNLINRRLEAYLHREKSQAEMREDRHTALAQIELAMNQQYELEATLNHIAEVTTTLLPASGGASLILWNPNNETYDICATTVPGQTPHLVTTQIRNTGGATRWIIDHRQPFIVTDVKDDPFTANRMLAEFSNRAYVGLPLLKDGQPLGVLYALDKQPRDYTADDLKFLTALANRAALVITQVSLYESLQAAHAQLHQEDVEKSHLIEELQAALAQIKTLQGLIPMCANCKNIRNDQGFWQQVETYIEEHSAATFSHGICNDCIKKLYPEFYKENEEDFD